MTTELISNLFNFDPLATFMIAMISFVGTIITGFSFRYMSGDSQFNKFFRFIGLLVFSLIIMVSTDDLFIFLATWSLSNYFLVKLMTHKPSWIAANASGVLTKKMHYLSFILISSAFTLFYMATKTSSIKYINSNSYDSSFISIALFFLLVAAMVQSAIWPFHKWLISSLNSPTPVSAIMHAGLVNGGGFLLARFAPLYLKSPKTLLIIFCIGLVTALIGTFWKLVQSDIKRMLACSTIAQMGFMMMQCGLGLFSSAVAHLCWHGLFKAYLFLASGGAAQEKRIRLDCKQNKKFFVYAIIFGLIGSYFFLWTNGKDFTLYDTTLVPVLIAFIALSQFSFVMLRKKPFMRSSLVVIATCIIGAAYGFGVYAIEIFFDSMQLTQPQPIHPIHILGMFLLITFWIIFLFICNKSYEEKVSELVVKLYVKAINSSQPDSKTITTHRNDYKYL